MLFPTSVARYPQPISCQSKLSIDRCWNEGEPGTIRTEYREKGHDADPSNLPRKEKQAQANFNDPDRDIEHSAERIRRPASICAHESHRSSIVINPLVNFKGTIIHQRDGRSSGHHRRPARV